MPLNGLNSFSIKYGKRDVTGLVEGFTALLLVICPLLQHYRGLVTDAGSEMLIILLPYTVAKLLVAKRYYIKPIVPCILYAGYISVIHGFSLFTLFREGLLIIFFIAILNGCIDAEKLIKAAKMIAFAAFICLLCQYFCYYCLHFHLQLVPTSRLVSTANQWIGLAQTGRISVTGKKMTLYRPSAFFLEPSHLAIFCIPLLVLLLISGKKNRKQLREALVISLAVLLSTSGLGSAIVIGTWLLYLVFYHGDRENKKKFKLKSILQPRSMIIIILAVVVLIGCYYSISVFRSSVNRIFFSAATGGNNAIQGRTKTGIKLMRSLSGKGLLIGRGTAVNIAAWNVSGFFYALFQFGIVGCFLINLLYFTSIFRHGLRKEYRWLAFYIFALSFFTVHTFAAFYRMYLINFILVGYRIMICENK